jgi:alkylglycerol monooxygenase
METNYIALSVPVFFILIVIELLIASRQEKKYFRFNDSIVDLSCGIGQQVTGIFIKTGLFAGFHYIYNNYSITRFPSDSIGTWVLAFIGTDFCYYWWHRMSHQVNFMWAVHVVHHQSEEYNLTVALRQAWFSSITGWLFYAPLAFIGLPPVVFITMNAFGTLYQFWIHTRTIGKLGPIEWIFNTASHHRVHHGRNPKYIDKNHGATLIIWDRLFGTFQVEEEEPLYGTVSPYTSWNPIWANFSYWVDLAKMAWDAPYFIDKIKIWFMFPGWQPREYVKQASTYIADPNAPVRFNTRTPRGLNWYIMAQFVPVTIVSTSLLFIEKTASLSELAGLVFLILLTSVIWGWFFEKRAWVFPLEIGRLVLIAAVTTTYFFENRASLPVTTAILISLFVFAVWLLRYRRIFSVNGEEMNSALRAQHSRL